MNDVIHIYELVHVYPTGVRRWRCDTCARDVITFYTTRGMLRILALAEGDETVQHSGTTGALMFKDKEASSNIKSVTIKKTSDTIPDEFSDFFDEKGL